MRKQGSAILTVMGAIVVLVVLAFSFIGSKHERAGISKFLSDEKKCEALAESASDLILSYVKKTANLHEDANGFYYLLRAPLTYSDDSAAEDGKNRKLDLANSKVIENFDDYVGYSAILEEVIKELDWQGKVKMSSKCEISHAEAFSPAKHSYAVAGINKEHLKAMGRSSEFLDSELGFITSKNEDDARILTPSDWKLKVKFPSGNPTKESKKFKVHLQSDTAVSEIMAEVNSANAAVNAAHKELSKAKANKTAAIAAGASDEELVVYDQAIAAAQENLAAAKAHNAQIQAAFSETDIDTSGGLGIKVELIVTRASETDMVFNIEAKLSGFIGFVAKILGIKTSYTLAPIDVEKLINEAQLFPEIETMDMEGLRKAVIDGTPRYNFETYVGEIRDRMDEVKNNYSDYTMSSDFSKPMIIEKGAILRITTTIEYAQSENKQIKRVLITEIPFKATDIQPIAPEYSFFVANSSLISDPSDILSNHTLGDPIDLNNAKDTVSNQDANLAAGRFIVHNLPVEGKRPDYDAVGYDTGRIPGMVRVNCNYTGLGSPITELRSFIGCLEEPELTEMNQMFTPNYQRYPNDNKFNTMPSFFWKGDNPKRMHEIEFPVLFEKSQKNKKIEIPGVQGFIDVYRRGGFDIVMVPTLLYGMGHMEYPLGLKAEGPINSIYSRICVGAKPNAIVCPKAKPVVTDVTEVYYSYEPVSTYSNGQPYPFDNTGTNTTKYPPAHYGMPNHKGYMEQLAWPSNNKYEYMPANCYDAMQYAKKATKFYNTSSDFYNDCKKRIEDGGLKTSAGYINLDGVYYIKDGDITFDSETTFIGKGLIVAKHSIDIKGNIKRANDETIIGLIARGGYINFECSEVHAACFSNNAPKSPEGAEKSTKIYGNLVCNDFIRSDILDLEVFYDNRITSVTPLASMRKVGKFEPKRYYVAFADNWSKFAYEKNKE